MGKESLQPSVRTAKVASLLSRGSKDQPADRTRDAAPLNGLQYKMQGPRCAGPFAVQDPCYAEAAGGAHLVSVRILLLPRHSNAVDPMSKMMRVVLRRKKKNFVESVWEESQANSHAGTERNCKLCCGAGISLKVS